MRDIIKLMRPHQYIKNLFILLPLFFALKITDTALLGNVLIAFIAFSLTASAIYALNDYYDIKEADGIASVFIGLILASTAGLLAYECKSLLIGETVGVALA